jgi:cystathionine beta-lyase family protein involved in aluminum resistance
VTGACSRALFGILPGGDTLILIARALGTTAEAIVGEKAETADVIREAYRRANYEKAMAAMSKIRKSLEDLGKIAESVGKLERILGRSAGMRGRKERVRRG